MNKKNILVATITTAALFFTSCASDQKNTTKGAGIGAAAGAIAGAIIGHQSGNREKELPQGHCWVRVLVE